MTNLSLEEFDTSGDLRQIADDAGAYDPTGSTRRNVLRNAGTVGIGIFGAGIVGELLSPLDAMAAATSAQKGAWSTSGKKSIKRGAINANDVKIANYALTLEYIEAAFYGIAASKGYADPDIAQAATILSQHESAHVKALQKVLGKAAVKTPAFNMDKVNEALATQESFIKTAASIEPVGTSAYAGAGPYVQNLKVVEAALSIHSVEANHAAYTASIVKFKGIDANANPVPNIFNPAASFKKVIGEVTSLGFTTGSLQP